MAWDLESSESRLALTAASIGATTLAFSATARSIGAAPSIARSTSAARSRIETTSLSGSAVTPSPASSSGVSGAESWLLIISPLHLAAAIAAIGNEVPHHPSYPGTRRAFPTPTSTFRPALRWVRAARGTAMAHRAREHHARPARREHGQ